MKHEMLGSALAVGSVDIRRFACDLDDSSLNSNEVVVMTAAISGILAEEDGCLRITGPSGTGGDAIVWQKDVLRIERRGDMVDIFDRSDAPLATWRLGDTIRGGGGEIRAQTADDHAGAGFSERCPGPYWLLGMVQ